MPKKGYKQSEKHREKTISNSKSTQFKEGISGNVQTQFKKGNQINLGRLGNKTSNWKGGITPINIKMRTSKEYKLWRLAVFERDNYTCIWCGAKSQKGKKVILNVDHIKPFALFPELRFAIDNGRTLCYRCHLTTKTYGGKIHSK